MPKISRPLALEPFPGLAERLLARSVRTETGCLEWQGTRDPHGYGSIRIGGRAGRLVRTHRASYAVFVRPLVDGEEVCHSCDNPPCLEPSHLTAADHQSNMAEQIARGRRRPDIAWVKGENHPQAKLTAEQVRDLRARRKAGAKYTELMATFGLSKATVGDICNRKLWRDLSD